MPFDNLLNGIFVAARSEPFTTSQLARAVEAIEAVIFGMHYELSFSQRELSIGLSGTDWLGSTGIGDPNPVHPKSTVT